MADETEMITKKDPQVKDSKIFNVSIRALVVLIVIVTICSMSYMGLEVKEPLYTLGGLVVGYYFGQNQKQHKV